MRVLTGVMNGSVLHPLIRHLLRKCHLPPRGKIRRVQEAASHMACTIRRGRWSLPLLSRFARHFPLTGGIGPIGPRAATQGRPYKRLPPSRGKLSADRLTDEGTHGGDERICTPPPHPSFAPQMPPSPLWGEGKGPPKAAAPTGDRRGQGGHIGPPLRRRGQGAPYGAPGSP